MMKMQQLSTDLRKISKENTKLFELLEQEKDLVRKKEQEIETVRGRLTDVLKTNSQLMGEVFELKQFRESTNDQ
jgi:hypothetical protein